MHVNTWGFLVRRAFTENFKQVHVIQIIKSKDTRMGTHLYFFTSACVIIIYIVLINVRFKAWPYLKRVIHIDTPNHQQILRRKLTLNLLVAALLLMLFSKIKTRMQTHPHIRRILHVFYSSLNSVSSRTPYFALVDAHFPEEITVRC